MTLMVTRIQPVTTFMDSSGISDNIDPLSVDVGVSSPLLYVAS